MLNLVTNAIKFSEVGGTVICRLSGTPTEVILEMSDTGIGIPFEEQEALFTKFFRGSAAREHAIEGTGLGLHIVASIVDNARGPGGRTVRRRRGHPLHRPPAAGRVTARAGRQDRSTFSIALPLASSSTSLSR